MTAQATSAVCGIKPIIWARRRGGIESDLTVTRLAHDTFFILTGSAQGTRDAALHDDLRVPQAQLIIRKGFHRDVDSYSAFMEADRRTSTGLAAYLKARGISKLYLCGLATDYCVAWSALDARAAGFEATVIEDACRAIDLNGSLEKAWADMAAAGVGRVQSTDI